MKTYLIALLALSAAFIGCDDDDTVDTGAGGTGGQIVDAGAGGAGGADGVVEQEWRGEHINTVPFGADDNSEIIKMLPSGDRAVLVASKARKITLLEVSPLGLQEMRTVSLFNDDSSESELTHIDIDSQGRFAVVTRTLPVMDGDTLVDCGGSLVFVDVTDTEAFGTVLNELAVGPMPDAVDLSDDDGWAVTADEVDFNDDKCQLADKVASVSIIEIPGGDPAQATVRATITMDTPEGFSSKREPEQIVFAPDNDRVATTLQDTHELVTFRISELLEGNDGSPLVFNNADPRIKTTTFPNRADGAEPWPDGVNRFTTSDGQTYFVAAGEFNDTIHVFDLDGEFVTQVEINPADMPADLPRNLESWSKAPFRPDSIAPFNFGGHQYLAFSLRHAGAVGVWQADDVNAITLVDVVKIGRNDEGTPETESTVGIEGIAANDNGLIVTANEKESSASLVAPLAR